MQTIQELSPEIDFPVSTEVRDFKHVPALDGLRGIAIIAVMFFHLGAITPLIAPFTKGASLGVQLFFVLSGFLITSILLKEHGRTGRIDLKNFYMRRTLRLVPAFWFYLIFVFIFGRYILPPDLVAAHYEGTHFLSAFLYYHNWDYFFSQQSLVLIKHSWSLAIEEQFYIFWSLALWFAVRFKAGRPLTLIATVFLIWLVIVQRAVRAGAGESPERLYFGTDTRVDALLIGSLAAFVYMWKIVPLKVFLSRGFSLLALGAGFVLTAVFSFNNHWQQEFYISALPIFAIAAAVVALWFVTREKSLAHLIIENRPLRYIGEISYGLYLWNNVSILLAENLFESALPQFSFAVLLNISIAAVTYHKIEKFFLKMKSRYS
jgi:peptidoglycan/LPS O-acetylase OafA/YrhL